MLRNAQDAGKRLIALRSPSSLRLRLRLARAKKTQRNSARPTSAITQFAAIVFYS